MASSSLAAATTPSEWSNEKTIQFLELYESERLLWDATDKNHKIKHKLHDAWNRISAGLENTPIDDLKLKKKSLMATFRPLLKKKKASMRSGAGAEDIFQPIWFAFDHMEKFLGTIYDVQDTINTEHRDLHSEDEMRLPSPSQPIPSSPQPVPSSSQSIPGSSQPVPSPAQANTRPNKTKRKVTNNIDEAENKISQTLDTLNQVLRNKKDDPYDEDECEIYGKLLAKRLRKYPESMRTRIMYQIDGLLLENPCPLARPLSANSRHSLQSQYSDYQISEIRNQKSEIFIWWTSQHRNKQHLQFQHLLLITKFPHLLQFISFHKLHQLDLFLSCNR